MSVVIFFTVLPSGVFLYTIAFIDGGSGTSSGNPVITGTAQTQCRPYSRPSAGGGVPVFSTGR